MEVGTFSMTPSMTAQPTTQAVTQVKSVENLPPKANGSVGITSATEIMSRSKEGGYIPEVYEKAIIKAIESANSKLSGTKSELQFSIHEKTKEIMVRILDSNSKEVIKEIPSEKILDMVASMCEHAGLFVDEKR